ncbi:Membrane-associated, eicosanoid/glutathione metabolism (MAPEG) protein [Cordyceps fumosorosea ARSEF 2679]|uniref:Membrane-associated, eicosanoid/glutathione metabolism (MAPEG) protein n=1 Tax=Cordyceps fumosorosea (strain ARSEF 2679) TaxID=1081104 RepID=A0A168ENZ3_CORFA|nr:Membrane-associated, eicosanoid/glutathione metabolism (MAPEG) protein [Cordyceps fumosorosea ARSEF 2679]OAA74047.1 Membrane-associated, eicosanoid/glutathione metabolism (MAPEG) protein [Cordyceps fumosorosea ARSEF 2679]
MATANLSFFTLPAVVLGTCIGPHGYAILHARNHYDNAYPRKFNDAIAESETLDKEAKARILRAQAASDNSFETLGYFAAAVVAGNYAGLESSSLNFLSIGYLVTRLAYVVTYIKLQDNRMYHVLRSVFWEAAFCFSSALWIKAGLNMMRK